MVVGKGHSGIQIGLVAARLHVIVDLRGYVPADDGAHVTHQALGFAQLALLNGLDDDQEHIVHFVVEILRSKLAAEIKANARRKDAIHLLEGGRISISNLFHQPGPGRVREVGSRFHGGGAHSFPIR